MAAPDWCMLWCLLSSTGVIQDQVGYPTSAAKGPDIADAKRIVIATLMHNNLQSGAPPTWRPRARR